MSERASGYVVATTIVVLGLMFYWWLKWRAYRNLRQETFGTFFLAGERVGQTLTTHNNWGLGLSFANAVWFWTYLGYASGIWIFLLQLPWVFGIVGLSMLVRKYLAASRSGTVHGFIGDNFGRRTSVMAAWATLIGYCLNVGFEMFYSSHLLATSFGVERVEFPVAIMVAIFAGAYCTAGGYEASVATDKYQNYVGSLAMVGLAAFAGFLLLVDHNRLLPPLVGTQFSAPPWHVVAGIAVMGFFFNFVDMANWQSIAANRALPDAAIPGIQRGFLLSAAIQMLVPALSGTWLGVTLKALTVGVADDKLYVYLVDRLAPYEGLASGVALGIIVFGLLSLTLSNAGSYLIAAMQTLSIDVWKRDDIREFDRPETTIERRAEIEREIISWAKSKMIIASLISVGSFGMLYYGLDYFGSKAKVFQFQFVIWGAAVSLVPVVLSQLLRKQVGDGGTDRSGRGFASIAAGLLAAFIPFTIATFFWEGAIVQSVVGHLPFEPSPDAIANLAPVFALLAATAVFIGFGRRQAV